MSKNDPLSKRITEGVISRLCRQILPRQSRFEALFFGFCVLCFFAVTPMLKSISHRQTHTKPHITIIMRGKPQIARQNIATTDHKLLVGIDHKTAP
jgi:hypothetical protein